MVINDRYYFTFADESQLNLAYGTKNRTKKVIQVVQKKPSG